MGRAALVVGPATAAVVAAIRDELSKRGMSRAKLEAASGIRHNRMGIIFRLESPITIEETRLICDALGITMTSLIRAAERSV